MSANAKRLFENTREDILSAMASNDLYGLICHHYYYSSRGDMEAAIEALTEAPEKTRR